MEQREGNERSEETALLVKRDLSYRYINEAFVQPGKILQADSIRSVFTEYKKLLMEDIEEKQLPPALKQAASELSLYDLVSVSSMERKDSFESGDTTTSRWWGRLEDQLRIAATMEDILSGREQNL